MVSYDSSTSFGDSRSWSYVILIGTVLAASCRQPSDATPSAPSSMMTVTPSRVNLGNIPQGRVSFQAVLLRNSAQRPIEVTRWQTSCECISVMPDAVRLNSGEEEYVEIRCDPSHNPEFVGDLGVQVVGYAAGGECVRFFVDVGVVPALETEEQLVARQADSGND